MSVYVRKLVSPTEPILFDEMPKFDFENPPMDPVTIAKHLAETMILHGGLGLACNQIGLPYRACSIQSDPVIVMFNPHITAMSDDFTILDEGCLSFPNFIVKVKRPNWVRVRYTEPNGNVVTNKFHGMTSRAICHEIDHLNGIVFWQRANRIHLDRAKKNAKLAARRQKSLLNTQR